MIDYDSIMERKFWSAVDRASEFTCPHCGHKDRFSAFELGGIRIKTEDGLVTVKNDFCPDCEGVVYLD